MLLRYGHTPGRGDLRLLVEAAPLNFSAPGGLSAALVGAPPGQALALARNEDAKVAFFNGWSGTPLALPHIGAQVDLSMLPTPAPMSGSTDGQPRIQQIQALAGLGGQLYAIDQSTQVVMRLDLGSGAATVCRTDAPPLSLKAVGGKIVVGTTQGTAGVPDVCDAHAPLISTGAPLDPILSNVVTTPSRSFEMSDRIIDISLPTGNTPGERKIFVSLPAGQISHSLRVSIGPGTCKTTHFLVSALFGAEKAATEVDLGPGAERLVLSAQQTAPGEDCVASLYDPTATGATAGEGLLRIRGAVEGAGSTTVLVDRSFSMERPLGGDIGGTPSGGPARVDAIRRAMMLLLGSLTVLPPNAGRWAVLPFSDDVVAMQAAPPDGLLSSADLASPDRHGGLRVKGFAGSQGDDLSPGGPTDPLRAVTAALARLSPSDPQGAPGPQRLWLFTDGLGGNAGYGDYPSYLPDFLSGRVRMRAFGVGGALLEPLLPAFLAGVNGLFGDSVAAPGSRMEFASTDGQLSESLVVSLVRDLLHGRNLGGSARGSVQTDNALETTFNLPGGDPWVLVLGAWEHPEATLSVSISGNKIPVTARCVSLPTAEICAAPTFAGSYKAALSAGNSLSAAEPARLLVFVGGGAGAGRVAIAPSLGPTLPKSGDRVRVSVRLTEDGLPLRAAKVTARVTQPGGTQGLGTAAAAASVNRDAILGLLTQDADLTSGEAKFELLDPMALPPPATADLSLADDGNGVDGEAEDGVYTADFLAALPGSYRVDLRVEHQGVLTPAGVIEDHLSAVVIPALDGGMTLPTVQVSGLPGSGRVQVIVTPQDRSGNLLGPGLEQDLGFLQSDRMGDARREQILSANVIDRLDGSYRAEVYGVMSGLPLLLRTPGGTITLMPADGVTRVLNAGPGCSATGHGHPEDAAGMAGLLVLCLLIMAPLMIDLDGSRRKFVRWLGRRRSS